MECAGVKFWHTYYDSLQEVAMARGPLPTFLSLGSSAFTNAE